MERNSDLLAGAILRMERLRQGMEQKAVCYGLCVPSYLCKIEQGTVHPNPDLLSALYQRLGIVYTQEESLLHPLKQMLPVLCHIWSLPVFTWSSGNYGFLLPLFRKG